MILDRLRDRLAGFHRAGSRDKGFILLSTIMLFVLVSGTVYWMVGTTQRTTESAVQTSNFVQAGQLADLGMQDALYTLNKTGATGLPTKALPRKGGTADDGSWTWYADTVTRAAGGKTTVLHASGTFRGATRNVQATAKGAAVGGFRSAANNSVTYQLAPSTAFSHLMIGDSVTVTSGITGASPFIAGPVGVTGSAASIKPAPGDASAAAVSYFQYGTAAASLVLPGAVRAPQGFTLDPEFVADATRNCPGTPEAWKASRNGGVLTAGNVGCYSSMDFDVPTVIEGDGAFDAYVTGRVTIRQNISAVSGTGLNIYSNEHVYFRTEDADGSSLVVRNVYTYAPQGTCRTVSVNTGGIRSLSKSLDFTGALACKTINIAGTFAQGTNADPAWPGGKGPIGPAGDAVFDNTIWYLADYQQPSGARTTPAP